MDGLNREISDFDIIIKNGTLVDGTGAKSKLGDIAIKNGIIEAIGNFSGKANQVIDSRLNKIKELLDDCRSGLLFLPETP